METDTRKKRAKFEKIANSALGASSGKQVIPASKLFIIYHGSYGAAFRKDNLKSSLMEFKIFHISVLSLSEFLLSSFRVYDLHCR